MRPWEERRSHVCKCECENVRKKKEYGVKVLEGFCFVGSWKQERRIILCEE